MKKYALTIGVDVAKSSLAVCYQVNQQSYELEVSNDVKGISQILQLPAQYGIEESESLLCCENTGSYMDKLAYAIKSTQITFWAVHPMIIKGYRLDLDRIKTDPIDASKIMEFAYAHQHKAVHYHHPDYNTRMLRDLFLVRKQLVKLRQQVLNMTDVHETKAISNPICSLIYQQLNELLDQYVVAVEKEIKLLIKKDSEYKSQMDILCSIPGIGPVISQHMLIITNGFKKFPNHKTFACHIGIAPFPKSSGTSIKYRPRTSKRAYQPLKADLHQGVISVIRKGQLFHAYYQHMIERGKHHLWIVNAIMNMIIKLAFQLIQSKQLFDKNFFATNKKSWNYNLEKS